MKIAQVTPRYFPHTGGIETHVKEIAERLAHHHDVEVISADLSPSMIEKEKIRGVNISRFRSFTWRNTLYYSPGIYAYLRKNKYDIIHAHNYHAFPALSASRAQSNNFIFTPHYHGKGSTRLTSVLLKPYFHIGKRIFHRGKKIICVSEYERDLIINDFHLSPDTISVIPNGVDARAISSANPFDKPKNLILSIGRLDKYKHIDLTIRAMSHLPDFHFFIIGKSGNFKKELTTLIETLDLDERVKILEQVTDEDKYRWLKTCSLFVNLSDTEAFGITVLEALAAGKSVIVNNAGGLREFAEKYPEIAAVDMKKFAGQDVSLGIAELMRRRSGLHFDYDITMYNWDSITRKLEQEYLNIIS